jgi:formylglycine-generating enzyme required for sulfatase activity
MRPLALLRWYAALRFGSLRRMKPAEPTGLLATLALVLRVARDLGLVVLLGIAFWKLAHEDSGNDSTEASPVPAATLDAATNTLGMVLLRVPAGVFQMGSSAYGNDAPVHEVRIAADFWIGRTEVTQREYREVMGASPSRFQGEDLPVEQVTWEEAAEFCRRLGVREKGLHRLPTEAEWEYACRAGSQSAFSFGGDDTHLGGFAWYDASSGQKTRPVGTRKPNPWGIHDMHGNVWEWCGDWYSVEGYGAGPAIDPQGPVLVATPG